MSKTKEQNFLQSWTPDYTNEKGEKFYESGKVAIILSEYAQSINKNIDNQKPILQDQYADNGEFSHWHLIDPQTGCVMWSSFPEETKAKGQEIILFDDLQKRIDNVKKSICNGKDIRCDNPSMDRNGNCRNCQGDMQTVL